MTETKYIVKPTTQFKKDYKPAATVIYLKNNF